MVQRLLLSGALNYFALPFVLQRTPLVVFDVAFMISYLLVFCREKEKLPSGWAHAYKYRYDVKDSRLDYAREKYSNFGVSKDTGESGA